MTTYRTRQEIFDLAWNGLKAQGFERSMHDNSECAYRAPDGRRCAVGYCIPDRAYQPGFEGLAAINPVISKAARVHPKYYSWVGELQLCHDHSSTPMSMELRLRDFARVHNLTIPGEA